MCKLYLCTGLVYVHERQASPPKRATCTAFDAAAASSSFREATDSEAGFDQAAFAQDPDMSSLMDRL